MTAAVEGTRVALGVGGWQVQAPLLAHVVAGMAAIAAGYVALYATKGARLHRRSGVLFVYAMLVMGLVGAGIATYERKPGSVFAGLIVAYMVTTALLAVAGGRRPARPGAARPATVAHVLLAVHRRGLVLPRPGERHPEADAHLAAAHGPLAAAARVVIPYWLWRVRVRRGPVARRVAAPLDFGALVGRVSGVRPAPAEVPAPRLRR
jgi:uncharacterized membrane protein